MADEPTGAPATTDLSTATPAAETPAAAPEAPAAVDWDALQAQLDQAYDADPKTAAERLRKSRPVAGLAGSMAERRFEELQRQGEAARQAKANEDALAALEREAEQNPLAFADRFRTHLGAERTREQIAGVERNAAKKLMEQIGAAYQDVPEWAELSDDEKSKLREAVADAHDDQALARFNRAALDIVADRRSAKKLTDRLQQEKEAWRKEWEAERLTAESSPDLRRPSSTSPKRLNVAAMDDKTFNEWWRKKYGT